MDVIRSLALATFLVAGPALLDAQDTSAARRDSTRRDSTLRRAPRLEQVTITATPVERTEPLTVTHIDTIALHNTPANTPWELLRQTAGLEAHEQGQGPGFASDLSIRGFSSDHSTDVALYIDGVPNNETVNGHAEGYNDLNLIPIAAVTGIDVVKGPTSALYGNFAFGGTVNVRTMDRYDGATIVAGGGSYGNAQGYGITGFNHHTSGGVIAVDGFREDGWRPNSQNQYGHIHARAFDDLSSNTTIDASVEGYLTDYESPGFLDTTRYNARQYNFISNFGDGGFKRHAQERVSLRSFLSPNLEWRTTVYSRQSTWNFWLSSPPGLGGLTEGTGAETREYDGRYGFGGTTALTYARHGVDVTVGAEGRYDHAHYESFAESSTGFRVDSAPLLLAEPAHQTSGGIFIQAGADVTKYARLDLGGRVDQLSSYVLQPTPDADGNPTGPLFSSQHSKGIFSPKVGVLVRPFVDLGHPGIALFANISRGFRQTDGVISDPTLPFITVWNYETGLRVDEGTLSVDASLFRMDVSNEQSFDPALNASIGGGQSRRNGLDVSAHDRIIPGVTASADFTILHAFYTHFINPDDGLDYSHTPVFNTSKYVGAAMVDVDLPTQIWQAHVGATFNGPYTPFEELGILRPGYILLNMSAGLKVFGPTELWVGVRNLADIAYRELESGAQVTPGQPRTIYAMVRVRTK